MKYLLGIFLFVLSVNFCKGQEGELSVETSPAKGTHYYLGESEIDKATVRQIMSKNPVSLQLLNKGINQQTTANILAGAGGVLIGWPIGALIAGKDMNWLLAGSGVILVAVSLQVHVNGGLKIKRAVNLHQHSNLGYNHPRQTGQIISLTAGGNGIGLRIQF